MHQCQVLYNIAADKLVYGNIDGVCRITGKKSKGILFKDWVRKTFNDFDCLLPGNIISNEALFCFDEASEILKIKTNKDKPQRFRSYSHIVLNNEWYALTKADKPKIFNLIISGASIVCLAETGQKHIFFKHKLGFWQIENDFIIPDIDKLTIIHSYMCDLFASGFSQQEIISGQYKNFRILKSGFDFWSNSESFLKLHRGSALFDFASFMIYA